MSERSSYSGAFQFFSRVVVFFAVLLIWWGAATTTRQAGMAFADWPLSLGSINPPGWLDHMAPFLEHSHRLLATLVGLLVLALFSWAYVRSPRRALEVTGLVVVLAIVFGVFVAAGAEREDPLRKRQLLSAGLLGSLVPVGWLAWSWWRRGWNLVEKLCALALLAVTAQAILGGLRVTEISNTFAVLHGCLAQAFFCLLLLIVMAAGRKWDEVGFDVAQDRMGLLRVVAPLLVLLVSMQLVFGASMRHFHRHGLADDGILKTQGAWIPSFDQPIIVVMFLHKAAAYLIFAFVLGFWLWARRGAGKGLDGRIRRHLGVAAALVTAQLALGMLVIATGKHFWITNFHVLNGLAILAVAFVFCVKAWRTRGIHPALANS